MIKIEEYIFWQDFCLDIKKKTNQNFFFGRCHPDHNGLTRDGKLPYSISEYEFNFMKDFIIRHNLKKGFELATGTCVSTLALGFGFSKTGGSLLSIDSYEEEISQNQPINSTGRAYEQSIDYALNQQLINVYNLENFVHLHVGWSPRDCERIIFEKYEKDVDFVFFDCPKTAEDFIRDASFLVSLVKKEKFAIFVHDTHCFMDEFNRIGQDLFGIKPRQITEFETPNGKISQVFPLSVITNIE